MKKDAANAYLTQEIMSQSPAKLVFMLYDRAISCLKDAITAIEKNDIETRFHKVSKARDIINHMWVTLDMKNGGSIAQNLDRLYGFILSRLPNIDFKNDIQTAREVIALLEPLRDSWKELAAREQAGTLEAPRPAHENNQPDQAGDEQPSAQPATKDDTAAILESLSLDA